MKETVCCFFGHHDATDEIKDKLRQKIRSLIVNENAQKFYVGSHGRFDYMVLEVRSEMKNEFPHINYAVVLAYIPHHPSDEYSYCTPEESIFPGGLEKVPRKYGILWRNDWMLKRSDTVICYVWHCIGGSGRMVEKALKQGKRVINLVEI